jgi:hypothetical protein
MRYQNEEFRECSGIVRSEVLALLAMFDRRIEAPPVVTQTLRLAVTGRVYVNTCLWSSLTLSCSFCQQRFHHTAGRGAVTSFSAEAEHIYRGMAP